MSSSFFNFKIRCQKCGFVKEMADGFETDDWCEVFVFSGRSQKNFKLAAMEYDQYYTCPSCFEKIDTNYLYKEQLIELNDVEMLISYLERMLPYIIKDGQGFLNDHGWEPDLDVVLYRYCLLYPQNQKLAELKQLYYKAIHDRKYFTKYEPPYGTKEVTANSVAYKNFLERIYLPDSVELIGEDSFSETGITDLFLPHNVTLVGKNAFKNCRNLSTVHSSDLLTEIGDYAFYNTNLRRFFFPESIKKIGTCAFKYSDLSTVFIPEGCEFIGEEAFSDCYNLKKVSLPKKFENIKKFFEPTADICCLNSSDEFFSEPYSFKIKFDYIDDGYTAAKKYDLMVNFSCSKALSTNHREDSLYSSINESCLSSCSTLVNDSDAPVGKFALINEPGITVTDHILNVKVPPYGEWEKDENLEKIKKIYSEIIIYASENNYKNVAFPLYPEKWNFHYYSELLIHIKPILKKYGHNFESISWYASHNDFFYKYETSK